MFKILCVGSYNAIMKEFYDFMISKENPMSVQLQICPSNRDNICNMMKIMEPQLVFVSLIGMEGIGDDIFKLLQRDYGSIPVLCFGNEREQYEYKKYFLQEQFDIITRPKKNSEILESIIDILHWKPEDEPKIPQVLFIDDDPVLLRTMRKAFRDKYDVLMATSGKEALFQLETKKPDVVFLDYEMPEYSGKDVLEQLRSSMHLGDLPVYFLTGVRQKEKIMDILELKPAGYLLKPAKIEDVEEIIERVVMCK